MTGEKPFSLLIKPREEVPISASEVAKRVLLTPVALLADGVLVIGGIPIFLLAQMFD